jgi:uncharacterized protein YdhG (YjbR/CyaY superfamily)
MKKAATVQEYLAAVEPEKRRALKKLRLDIKAAAPKATEVIAWSMPCFKQEKLLVSYFAAKNHCSFFCMSGNVLKQFSKELEKYDTSKGTIRFQADKPLPASLVKKIVKARLAEIQGGTNGKRH